MPRKIRQLLSDYRKAGFFLVKGGGKGDQRKLRHSDYRGAIILDGKESADAKPYQEKQLKSALYELEK